MTIELDAQTRSLRSLAWRIVRDEQLAEDAAQDAWVALLESRRTPRNVSAWVVGAARNLARRTLRKRARVVRRQEAAARPEAVPSSATLAAEAEILRSIATAVMQLDLLYRDVIVMRFYRDMKPAAIAEALDLPVATVKTRLRRGLEALRGRLNADSESRGWMLALVPMLATKSGVSVGVVATLVVCVALLLGGWMWRNNREDVDHGRRDRPPIAQQLAHVNPDESTSDGAESDSTTALVNRVRVRGAEGTPIAGVQVRIAPIMDYRGEVALGTTDRDGVCFFPDLEAGMYQVFAESPDHTRRGRFAEFPGSHDLELRSGCRLKVRLEPWPHPGWASEKFSAQSLRGNGYVEFAPDRALVDLGVWPAGDAWIARSPVGGGGTRTQRVALPDSGELVHVLRVAVATAEYVEVRVHDVDSGEIIRDWQAWAYDFSDWRKLERHAGSMDGVFKIAAWARSPVIDAPGYARARCVTSGQVARVELSRGVTVRVQVEGSGEPREVEFRYNSPVGNWSRGVGVGPGDTQVSGVALDLSDPIEAHLDVLFRAPFGGSIVALHMPEKAKIDVYVTDANGCRTRTQIQTGEAGSDQIARVRCRAVASREVRVEDESGRPIADARVAVHVAPMGKIGSVPTDARGRATLIGLRTDRTYELQLVGLDGAPVAVDPNASGEIVMLAREPARTIFRVLVLDASGNPVSGVRVQFSGKPTGGDIAISGEDGIAVGRVPSPALNFVAVQWAPTVNGWLLNDPPPNDPIIYRDKFERIPIDVDIVGTGVVKVRIKTSVRERVYSFHVYGRGIASLPLRVPPGECELWATLNGQTINTRFVARQGEPLTGAQRIPLVFVR